MKNLIVVCHPNPKSFTCAIAKTVEESLAAKGETFVTRNLYELKFNPILAGADFMEFRAGRTPADIAEEQRYITAAENIIFVYPLWWTGLPAMLKGYVDRVFSRGFAYDFGNGSLDKKLRGKRGLLITCHGNPKDFYESVGMYNALNMTTDNGIFDFCGIEVVGHQYFDSVPAITDADRKNMLVQVQELIKKLK